MHIDQKKHCFEVQKPVMFDGNRTLEEQQDELVNQALTDVGLLPEFASRFPHEFSGGQRQRIMWRNKEVLTKQNLRRSK